MDVSRKSLWLPMLALLPSSAALAQGTGIPASAPTQVTSGAPMTQTRSTAGVVSGPAEVTWTGALLSIRANGQSLPAILRQIARLTGMKVTGGAPGEPVFGTYGPGPVQTVMASLFDGMTVNMLLVNDSPTRPKELILTARTGGATPPAPTQDVTVETGQVTTNPADANLAQPHSGRHTSPYSFQGAPLQTDGQQDAGAPGAGVAPAAPVNDGSSNNGSPAPATTDANGTPQSPNGVRTPEQIFEELRKRQQGASQ